MGRIECGRHGREAIALVCEHLAEDAREQRRLGPREAYTIELDGAPLTGYDFCLACVARLGLPVPARALDMEVWDGDDELLPVVPVCGACYREAGAR